MRVGGGWWRELKEKRELELGLTCKTGKDI